MIAPKEAKQVPDGEKWLESMGKEMANIDSKGTWREMVLPPDRKATGWTEDLEARQAVEGAYLNGKVEVVKAIGKDMIDQARRRIITPKFSRSEPDWDLHYRPEGRIEEKGAAVLLDVDNLALATKSVRDAQEVFEVLGKSWIITDLGEISMILERERLTEDTTVNSNWSLPSPPPQPLEYFRFAQQDPPSPSPVRPLQSDPCLISVSPFSSPPGSTQPSGPSDGGALSDDLPRGPHTPPPPNQYLPGAEDSFEQDMEAEVPSHWRTFFGIPPHTHTLSSSAPPSPFPPSSPPIPPSLSSLSSMSTLSLPVSLTATDPPSLSPSTLSTLSTLSLPTYSIVILLPRESRRTDYPGDISIREKIWQREGKCLLPGTTPKLHIQALGLSTHSHSPQTPVDDHETSSDGEAMPTSELKRMFPSTKGRDQGCLGNKLSQAKTLVLDGRVPAYQPPTPPPSMLGVMLLSFASAKPRLAVSIKSGERVTEVGIADHGNQQQGETG
ncbi:hypothetical protein M231_06183 [Tremella mesenterica]|uniref:Uncharacterized protein n=1 Tax=Tremella mesenterica TaxID=5217 RepID=A0A4Q1BEI3_TREME|nr:hypothetical protein M231_06183 [Tremella mesenterica]